MGYGEVVSRIARSTGLLAWVAEGLAASAAGGWPPEAKLRLMADHLDQVRTSCSESRALLDKPGARAEAGTAAAGASRPRRRRRPSECPASFGPGRALGFVAAARGIADKNARDLPRLLREALPTGDEIASLLDRLRLLESAATRLAECIVGRHARQSPRSPLKRPGSPGRGAGRRADLPRGVSLDGAPEGPPDTGGTYVVVFRNDAEVTIAVGALGTFEFAAGYYCYVDSAFGPGGVRARTNRHFAQGIVKKKWNIDYMKPPFLAVEVWWTNDTIRRECSWSAALAATPGFTCPAKGFGSHDCRVNRADGFGSPGGRLCAAHLYHRLEPPDVHDFARRLGRIMPGHATMYRQRLGAGDQGGVSVHTSGVISSAAPRRLAE